MRRPDFPRLDKVILPRLLKNLRPASVLVPVMRRRQACYAGPNGGLAEWLHGYERAGVTHLVVRFAGNHERHLETVAALRGKLMSP